MFSLCNLLIETNNNCELIIYDLIQDYNDMQNSFPAQKDASLTMTVNCSFTIKRPYTASARAQN